jgi:MFS family permease
MIAAVFSSPQRRIVLTFCIAAFSYSFSAWAVAVYLPLHLEKSLGLSRTAIGSLISLYTVTLLILAAPFGHLSDRASPKRIIQTGLLLFAVHALVLARANHLSALLVAQIIGGVGNSLVIIGLPSLYYKHLSLSRKGQKVGMYIFATFLGFAFGPLVGGFLLNYCALSYRGMFLALAALVLGVLWFSKTLKDALPFKMRLFEYREDLFRKEVFLLVCMLVAMGIHYGNERASLPLYMHHVIQLDDFAVGTIFAMLGLWIAVLSAAAGTLWDRNKKVLLFICLGLVVSGVSHMATAFTNSYASVLLVRLLHTTGDALVIFSMHAIIASIFPSARMGGNVGFTSFFQMFGGFFGALVSGYLDGHSTYRASFLVAGSATIIVGLLLAANWRTMLNLSRQLSK